MDDDFSFDQGREATAVQDTLSDGAESLLNELSGAFDLDEPALPTPPQPLVEAIAPPPEETPPVSSPPRIEPPVMIWKPSRRARFKLRLR